MSQKYILGIDGGTQSTKVILFDLEGNEVCQASKPLRPLILGEPVVALHPDDDLWDSLIEACGTLFREFRGDKKDILGVGLCTIRCCRVLLKEDGELAYPVLSWMDKRLSEPYGHDVPDVRYVTTTTGYITHRLTGETRDTCANYEGMWPVDYRTGQWTDNQEEFQKYNIPRDMLFDLVNPGDFLGSISQKASALTGIPEGIPVFATANDKAVEMLGAGRPKDTTLLVSLGTYITSMIQGEYIEGEQKNYWLNMASEPGRFLYESYGIRRGMWSVSWARDLMGREMADRAKEQGVSTEDYLNCLAEKIPAGCEGLMIIPEFLAPVTQPYKRGVILGLNGKHKGIHIYRAVQEAIALTMYNYAKAMMDELGKPIDRVLVSGGGSRGDLFMQIFADVFGVEAFRNKADSAVGLGTAICAAVGLGIYEDYDEAIAKMVRTGDSFIPVMENHDFYQKINTEVYAQITDYTDEVLKKSFAVFSGS